MDGWIESLSCVYDDDDIDDDDDDVPSTTGESRRVAVAAAAAAVTTTTTTTTTKHRRGEAYSSPRLPAGDALERQPARGLKMRIRISTACAHEHAISSSYSRLECGGGGATKSVKKNEMKVRRCGADVGRFVFVIR